MERFFTCIRRPLCTEVPLSLLLHHLPITLNQEIVWLCAKQYYISLEERASFEHVYCNESASLRSEGKHRHHFLVLYYYHFLPYRQYQCKTKSIDSEEKTPTVCLLGPFYTKKEPVHTQRCSVSNL